MPGFVTDCELKALLRDSQQRVDLDTVQDSLISRASVWAYNLILRGLAKRGYTAAQIAAADAPPLRDLQTDLVFWKVISELARNQPDTWSKEALNQLDRRKEVTSNDAEEQFVVLTGGAWTWPGSTVGQMVVGPEDTSEDLFGLDPDDPRIGQTTRF